MNDRQRLGRDILLAALVTLLSVSAANGAMILMTLGESRAPRLAIRFGLTVLLVYLTYSGSSIAKWLLAFLLAIGGVLSIYTVVTQGVQHWVSVWLFAMGAVFLTVALIVTVVPHVREFLRFQRYGNEDADASELPFEEHPR